MRRLFVAAAVTLTALVLTAGPLAASSAVAPRRYVNNIFPQVNVRSGITYGTAIDEQTHLPVTLKLDMYTGVGDTDTRRPAIVWVHGGAFAFGNRVSGELVDEATQFAMKGYVNVSIDYRLAEPGCVPGGGASCLIGISEALQDAQTAIRFLRAKATKFGIDPTRIAIGGSSAGAITALNVGYTTSTDKGEHERYSSTVEAVQSFSGCAVGTTPRPGGAPALLFQGTADPLLPYWCAQTTFAAAKAAGLVAALVAWPGEGHVPYVQNRNQIINTTTLFFYEELHLARAS